METRIQKVRTVHTIDRTRVQVSWDDIRAALHAKGVHLPKEPTVLRALSDGNDRFEGIEIEFSETTTETIK